MITPDYLEQVMSQAQNTLNGASERIIQTLARRLEATITRYGKNDLIPTSLNEILNLEEVGMTYAEVQKEVEEALPQIRDQVREAFIKGAEKMNEYYGGGVRDTYKEGKEQPKTEPKEEPKNPVKPPLPEKDYDFPDFVATTGYGNMLGLCGINCRHTFSMFFPNLQDSTPDVIDEKANRKKYQAEQQARAMERQIRAKKQALSAYQAVSDEIGKAKKQALVNEINSLIKQYQNFCRTNSVSMTEWRLATYDSHASFTKPRNYAKATPNASNMSGAMKKKLEEVYRRTNGDIYNICQTTAPSTQDTFINACDDAFMNIQMGMPLNEAISRAIDQVAEKGVSCVYYNSGRVDKMEVALARAIRTGINQANAQLVLMKCAELGIDYVKVSAHYGARVTKQNDYTNHSWWQGKVYKLNWSNKALNGFKSTNNPTDTEKATEQPKTAQEYANNARINPENVHPISNYAKDVNIDTEAEKAVEKFIEFPINEDDIISVEEAEKIITSLSKKIDQQTDKYDKLMVLYEMRKSQMGRTAIKWLEEINYPIIFMNGLINNIERGASSRKADVVKYIHVYSNKNDNLKQMAQALIHETLHVHYGIEETVYAETICVMGELFHARDRMYATPEEWNKYFNVVKEAYNDFEIGDIKDYGQFIIHN